MILRANPVGPPIARRYVIQNLEDGKVWTGEEFVESTEEAMKNDALKYATPTAACADMQEIMRIIYGDKPCRRYVVPIELEVYGDDDITLTKVARWMHQASVLNVRTHQYGNGPRDSLVLPVVHWGLIKEIQRPVMSIKNLDEPDDVIEKLGEIDGQAPVEIWEEEPDENV